MQKKNILIVDDSPSIRELLKMALQSEGYTVFEATDGQNATSFLTGLPIDLIITDLNMPNMDGISLIKDIRSKPSYEFTPVLLLTTESSESKKIEAKAAGATGYIIKPIEPPKLLDLIRKLAR